MLGYHILEDILRFMPQDYKYRNKLEEQVIISKKISEYALLKYKEFKERGGKSDSTGYCGTKVYEVSGGLGSTYWFEGFGYKTAFYLDDIGEFCLNEQIIPPQYCPVVYMRSEDNPNWFYFSEERVYYSKSWPKCFEVDNVYKILNKKLSDVGFENIMECCWRYNGNDDPIKILEELKIEVVHD